MVNRSSLREHSQIQSICLELLHRVTGRQVEADQRVHRHHVLGQLAWRITVETIRYHPVSERARSRLLECKDFGLACKPPATRVCVPRSSGLARPDRNLMPGPWAEGNVRGSYRSFDRWIVESSLSHVSLPCCGGTASTLGSRACRRWRSAESAPAARRIFGIGSPVAPPWKFGLCAATGHFAPESGEHHISRRAVA